MSDTLATYCVPLVFPAAVILGALTAGETYLARITNRPPRRALITGTAGILAALAGSCATLGIPAPSFRLCMDVHGGAASIAATPLTVPDAGPPATIQLP